ncbi:hypothetical protein TRAPUB_9179, partial [Trametes pubescens]
MGDSARVAGTISDQQPTPPPQEMMTHEELRVRSSSFWDLVQAPENEVFGDVGEVFGEFRRITVDDG